MVIKNFRILYHNGITHTNEIMSVFATDEKTAKHIVKHSFMNKNSYIIEDKKKGNL